MLKCETFALVKFHPNTKVGGEGGAAGKDDFEALPS